MNIVLVRHGETPWNLAGRMQGRLDIALSAQGHQQARSLLVPLLQEPLAGVVHTGLLRTRQTLLPLLQRRPELASSVQIIAEFAERDYGHFQGLTPAERLVADPQAAALFLQRDPATRPPQGESLLDFQSRVMAGLQALHRLHQSQGSPSEPWLLCAHGGVLDLFYRWAQGIPLHLPRQWPIPNAGIARLLVANATASGPEHLGVVCHEWANTAHLLAVTERGEVEF